MAKDDNGDNERGDDDWFGEDEEVIDEQEFEAEGWEEIPDDPEAASRLLAAFGNVVPDILKRTIEAGVDGISMSEERIRKMLGDQQKMPKEVVAYLLKQVDWTKREFVRILSREVREVLEDVDLGGELAKILTTLSLEAKIQVRFIENEEGSNPDSVKPKASGKMRWRQSEDEDADAEEGDDEGDDEDET